MPRVGGEFVRPFPPVESGNTIESAVHNGTVADFVLDANNPRPITAGGTAAVSAAAARANLQTERAMQTVTNYDSHVFESGSFASGPGATSAPDGVTSSRYFFGTAITSTGGASAILEAYDLSDSVPHTKYLRSKDAGSWSTWTALVTSQSGADARYVNTAGDTVSGNLAITGTFTVASATSINALSTSTINTNGYTITAGPINATGNVTATGSISTPGTVQGLNVISTGPMFANSSLSAAGGVTSAGTVQGLNVISTGPMFANSSLSAAGKVTAGGYTTRTGLGGASANEQFNVQWQPGVGAKLWIDALDQGLVWSTNAISKLLVANGYIQFTVGGFMVQWGSAVTTTDAGGYAVVTYPTAFPTATLVNQCINGDTGVGGNRLLSLFKGGLYPTTSQFAARVIASNTGLEMPSTAIRIDWIAIGY